MLTLESFQVFFEVGRKARGVGDHLGSCLRSRRPLVQADVVRDVVSRGVGGVARIGQECVGERFPVEEANPCCDEVDNTG